MARRTEDIESADTWDFENAESRPGIKPSRAVVSVAFPREDFERVAEAAESAEMNVSEFIRRAALNEVMRRRGPSAVMSTSGSLGFVSFTMTHGALTAVQGRARPEREPAAVTA